MENYILKKLIIWLSVGLLTTALLDPIIYSMLEQPVPWLRDLTMAAVGSGGLYLLYKYRHDL
jgi:hypothetical protein